MIWVLEGVWTSVYGWCVQFNSMTSTEKVHATLLTLLYPLCLSLYLSSVCPAEWSEGAKTIKPSTKEPLDLDAICASDHSSKKPYASEVDDMCRLASGKKHSGK
jgi:hypothetical protein